jgi:ABC-2 type transport system permease protein
VAERISFAFKYWRQTVGLNIRSQMTYRVAFLFEFFGVMLVTLLEFIGFVLVLPRFDNIGGWQLGEIAFLAGMVNLAFGLMDMFFSGFDPGNFGQHVRLGRFDQFLLRPVNITLQVIGSEFVLRRVGRILAGAGIFLFSLSLVDVAWTGQKFLVLLLAILGQIGFFGALFIIGATITFWTVESIELMNIFTYGGSEMISYPMHIYPRALQRFFTFVLPAIFLNYYPAIFILELPDPLGMPVFTYWLSAPVGVLMLLAARQIWHFGINHYQSTGT